SPPQLSLSLATGNRNPRKRIALFVVLHPSKSNVYKFMPLTSRVSTLSMSLNWDQNRSETLESKIDSLHQNPGSILRFFW
ncbi:unnamed protein product, partial [Brassica oleracea]